MDIFLNVRSLWLRRLGEVHRVHTHGRIVAVWWTYLCERVDLKGTYCLVAGDLLPVSRGHILCERGLTLLSPLTYFGCSGVGAWT